jgi:hypothetical protein
MRVLQVEGVETGVRIGRVGGEFVRGIFIEGLGRRAVEGFGGRRREGGRLLRDGIAGTMKIRISGSNFILQSTNGTTELTTKSRRHEKVIQKTRRFPSCLRALVVQKELFSGPEPLFFGTIISSPKPA